MGRTISLPVLNELFEYNAWARDRQLQACAALTEEQFVRPLGNSFPSVRDTLAHLAAVEWIWLERWRGRSPRSLPSTQKFSTLAALTEGWRVTEREMREYLSGLNEDALDQVMTYVNTRGQTWTYSLWRTVLHLLNHQSYHRGQVTTLLRQLETEPPPVDFLVALDMKFSL